MNSDKKITNVVTTKKPVYEFKNTEILWDTYGVPHIHGKDIKSLFYAFAWAQMQSHGNLILRFYGQARGRASEYWGEEHLESDQWLRTMGVPERAREWFNAQNPTFRSYLDAFANGINSYAKEHPELIDNEVKVVLPIDPVDLLAHVQRVIHFMFVVEPKEAISLVEQENSDKNPLGSNAWAIAPSRSTSGNAMLLANPHLPWFDLFLCYEAQLTAPDIDIYGTTLIGIPVLMIAFNDQLAWTHTVNTHHGWNVYELELINSGYSFDDKVLEFETEEKILKVKREDGMLHSQPLIVQRSVHGPVFAYKDGKAFALRVAGLDQPGILEQWWDMACATNLNEFETALQRMQLPTLTVMYADKDGHIMHLFNGQVPVRSQGDFEFWRNIIPGNTSTTLWTDVHPYSDLPRVLDPASGWLQNANDSPWTTTFPIALRPEDYPPYMAPRGPMGLRAQRSAQMLVEHEKISFEQVIACKHSTRVELANRILDDLISAAQQHSGDLVRRAAEVLNTWNRHVDADSRGAFLFAVWFEEIDFSNLFAIPWKEDAPLTTPKGLANPAGAIAALEVAATKVETAYRALDISWGEVFRMRYGNLDLPANGGPDIPGIFRGLLFAPQEDGKFAAVGGDCYVAVVEFSNPVRAMVLTSYGNASQPGSPHIGDQLEMFARKQLRPVWRSRSEVEFHLASRKVF
ncbi:peptidase S45, penicillin amidase (plasmid) [Fischerella sp. NIES-4106]|nr:peptidase S45, penicillin amidase [Fischerella sp. NIES-4106]